MTSNDLARPSQDPRTTSEGGASRAPLVSVVMPAYNTERTIGAAISGVLTQDYPRLELVIVDDGSQDRTREICEAYGDSVTVVAQANAGTAAARNAGIMRARGEIISLCDSDDMLLPNHVSKAVEALQSSGSRRCIVTSEAHVLASTGIAHGRMVLSRGVPSVPRQRLALLQANFVGIFCTFPRSMLDEIGFFDPDCPVEDWDLWLRAVFAGWEVVAQQHPTALYRWSEGSKSTDHSRVFAAEDEVLRRVRQRAGRDLRPDESRFLERRLALGSPRLLVSEGDLALREGRYGSARERYRQASELVGHDRRVRVRRALGATRPGAALLAWRLRAVDRATGRDPRVFR